MRCTSPGRTSSVFYATPATGAAWIVPKKYIEKVGEDGFKRQPVGLNPLLYMAAPYEEIRLKKR